MSRLQFKSKAVLIGDKTVVRIPKKISAKLPSRGLVVVTGTINDAPVTQVLEPDGKGSHWFELDSELKEKIGSFEEDMISLDVEPTKDWPEPEVPSDIKKALNADKEALSIWNDITPLSRWDWIRWIRSTNNPETREKRITVTLSKLNSGKRQACCFNRSMCTDPEVSKSGVLLE